MKNIIPFLFIFALLMLSSCMATNKDGAPQDARSASAFSPQSGGPTVEGPRFTMEAVVCELGQKITVDVTKSEYTSGVHLVIPDENITVSDEKGNSLSLSDIRKGDKVRIVYNGQVMLSYPPQIVALSITVLK